MQGVQICKNEIETNDEIALHLLRESVFYDTIQSVPETLPRPIPKTIPYRLKHDQIGIRNELNIWFTVCRIFSFFLGNALESNDME